MEETAPQTPKSRGVNKGIIVIAFIVIVALAIVGYEATKPKDTTTATTPAPTTSSQDDGEPAEGKAMTATTYKNGTYTVVGNYTAPSGPEEIGVTITLEGDVITAAEVESKSENPTSQKLQGIFIENFKPQVVGKSIDEVQLDKVSSSSLTPKGFNDALEKVKAEAKA